MLHGGDYNPDQWIRTPEVWDEDMRLMKLAGCNAMSTGIFSWVSLEPEEGRFDFGWLDTIMDKLAANGAFAVLATPSGSKPAWMSEKYPEVCRVDAQGRRAPHGARHNHCRTSPVYREKCRIINTELARRYKDHPALLVWHVSNEYNAVTFECHCELCYATFRRWLRARYHDDLGALNHAWWTAFWSHTFTDWELIRPLDHGIHGLMLDWKRFTSDQTIDFFRAETAPLREHTPHVPVTTNFMGFSITLDYWKFAREVDVVSWDNYPTYHDRPSDWLNAIETSLAHDMNRSFKQKPHMQMECSPSVQNWKPVNKLKRPGLHVVEGMQSIAHGGDSVLYFQWRKNRGGAEKFHGAVVDHYATEHTRVFREVAELGRILGSLDDVVGTTRRAEVAILHDWENRWAIDQAFGPRNERKEYVETCVAHYRPFWSAGVACDVVSEDSDFSPYKLLIAPMLYMVRPSVAERIEAFVCAGGVFVTTYLSGIANESDLCFLNGFPGPLRKLMGVWAEEIDALYDNEVVEIAASPDNNAGLTGTYKGGILCDLIHAEGARVLATYESEFYKGRPAVTVNAVGKGRAYYIASRNEPRFHADFYRRLIDQLRLRRALGTELPDGVTAQVRTDGKREFVFLLSFNRAPVEIDLGKTVYRDLLTCERLSGVLGLPPYTARILQPHKPNIEERR
jgi:beta-galactosidase